MHDLIQFSLVVAALFSGLIMLIVGVMSALDNLLDIYGGDDAED